MKGFYQETTDSSVEQIYVFTEFEDEAYNLQIPTLLKDLLGATDKLSNYTCHSQPHVTEVMQQADMIFHSLDEWLITEAGFSKSKLQSARKHLLLSAKFHDIGMAGSSSLRSLLSIVDELHILCKSSAPNAFSDAQGSFSLLDTLSHNAEAELSCWDGYDRLCGNLLNKIVYANNRNNLCPLLQAYHELIKNTIRKYHGEISARWINENRHKLVEHYGSEISWELVALLAALHSGSLFIHHDESGIQHGWQEYCKKLCGILNINNPLSENPALSRRFLSLASILRIADQRRSGNNLRSLDKHEIQVDVAEDGRIAMKYEVEGVICKSKLMESDEVIVSERLNNFGSFKVRHSNDRWIIEHELQFSNTINEYGRYLLINKRIPSYIKELQSTVLKAASSLHHILYIKLCDSKAKKTGSAIEIGVSELLQTKLYPDGSKRIICFSELESQFQQYNSIKIEIVP